jgi:hypothetical protein
VGNFFSNKQNFSAKKKEIASFLFIFCHSFDILFFYVHFIQAVFYAALNKRRVNLFKLLNFIL